MERSWIAASALALCACGDEGAERVEPVPAPPVPVAEVAAGFVVSATGPAEIDEGSTATLSGELTGGVAQHWTWKQLSGPPVKLATPAAASTVFVAPDASADFELIFELTAERGDHEGRARVAVRVRADDDPPACEVFAPSEAECGARVVLTGQGRTAEPQKLTYAWKQIGDGPRLALESSDSAQATFVAPEHTGEYVVALEFSVTDGVNAPVSSKAEVHVACDPAAKALSAGETRTLTLAAGAPEVLLPRGSWLLSGALSLSSTEAPTTGLLRLVYARDAALVLEATRTGASLALRSFGQVRDGPHRWREPHISGSQEIGVFPGDQALGFELVWDGQELAANFGPPGERDSWPQSPYPLSFPLAARPSALQVESPSDALKVESVTLIGR